MDEQVLMCLLKKLKYCQIPYNREQIIFHLVFIYEQNNPIKLRPSQIQNKKINPSCEIHIMSFFY